MDDGTRDPLAPHNESSKGSYKGQGTSRCCLSPGHSAPRSATRSEYPLARLLWPGPSRCRRYRCSASHSHIQGCKCRYHPNAEISCADQCESCSRCGPDPQTNIETHQGGEWTLSEASPSPCLPATASSGVC